MFFEFTLEQEYPESDWPRVWEIERHIFAWLMVEHEVIRRIEKDPLADLLKMHLRYVAQSNEVAPAGEWTDDFVEAYLEQQVPSIHEYLRRTPNADPDSLRVEVFQQCVRNSPVFSTFIRES